MQDIKQQEEMENPYNNYVLALFDQYKEQYLELCDKAFKTGFGKPIDPISLAVEQEKERVIAMVLKEIEGMYKTPLNEERESVANVHNHALDILKEKLQTKQ